MITTLIDKQDNFEMIRDKIASILATEIANQQVLATAALKDPELWKLRIYSERSNPWEIFTGDPADTSPIINIWYDNSQFDGIASNISERQKTDGIFNIDCYGYAVSKDIPAGGHTPGDQAAALEVQRALRLVRNILMSSEYVYLGMRGIVGKRWPQSVTVFQPQINNMTVENVTGARIAFKVEFNEFAPQYVHETLDLISVDVHRAEDGLIVINADYDYTTP